MSSVNFPSNIIPLTSKNYSFSLGSNVVQTPVGGMPRSGLDLTIEAVPFSLNFLLSDYQYQIFNQFYYAKINSGANSFNMDLDAGIGLETVQCKIQQGSLRIVRPNHGTWSVSFSVYAESTSSQTEEFCNNIYELNECYGNDTPKILAGYAPVLDALPDA